MYLYHAAIRPPMENFPDAWFKSQREAEWHAKGFAEHAPPSHKALVDKVTFSSYSKRELVFRVVNGLGSVKDRKRVFEWQGFGTGETPDDHLLAPSELAGDEPDDDIGEELDEEEVEEEEADEEEGEEAEGEEDEEEDDEAGFEWA
jgi:hypothetical protein